MIDGYIPGSCNIGEAEVRRRKIITLLFFCILIVITPALLMNKAIDHYYRLLLVFPFSLFIISYTEWCSRFNVIYGLRGRLNFGKIGEEYIIVNHEYKRKDRLNAIKIILIGVLGGILEASLLYYLSK